MVTGGQGTDKTALLAAWLDRRERAGAVVPHHFIRRGKYDRSDPVKLVDSLMAQLEQRFPDQREPEADAHMHPAARLEAALRRVSESVLTPRGERLVVLIDGLDEYDPSVEMQGDDPLAAFLPRTLPPEVRFLCASRSRHPYVDMLVARGALQLDLDDEQAFGDDNAATVRPVWWRMLAADVAVVGVCAALMVWNQRERSRGQDPLVDSPHMARFQAADVYLGVFAAFPDDCRQIPSDENCAEWRHPESVQATHIAAFELDRKEATNDDFCAWLNNHPNDWSLEADGVVTARKNHLPLMATTGCAGDLSIASDGRAEPTAGAAQRPVTCVTWYGAEMYCSAQNKRLPLEAEWERAAKGAGSSPFPWGADTSDLDGVAYHLSGPRPVGTSAKDVSPEGVYDLAGNVAEWVQSERNTPDKRVVRGGSYLSDVACRLLGSKCARIPVKNVGRNVGFRCARNIDEPSQSQERTQ